MNQPLSHDAIDDGQLVRAGQEPVSNSTMHPQRQRPSP